MLYSIIIPHKNIPHLLQRCLDSIPEREDIQVIVVDDNSSPDRVDFGHFPGNGRRNVRIVLTKEGRGAGYARNEGLKQAKGKWLLFADADDFFLPGFLDALDAYRDTDYDLVTFRAESADCDTLEFVPSRQGYYSIYEKIAEDMDTDFLKYRNDVPWAKMISAKLVQEHSICFDETPVANDVMFSAYVDYYAYKTAACSTSIYCATVRQGSLQYAPVLSNLLVRLAVACRLNRFLRQIGRKDKYVYSYFRVVKCRESFGWKGYLKALSVWLYRECGENIYKTFSDLLKAKLHLI